MTRLLAIPRVAERLDCSRTHVYRLIAAGELRSVEIKATGKRPKTRVRSDDLEAFIDARTRTAPDVDASWRGGSGEVRRIDGT
jgi:excisionase family DNA binding protein